MRALDILIDKIDRQIVEALKKENTKLVEALRRRREKLEELKREGPAEVSPKRRL